jgi:replicative DNA helicase
MMAYNGRANEEGTMTMEPTRHTQQNLEAEQAVLGSILLNSAAYDEVASFLKAGDFYLHKHRWIWEAVEKIVKAGRAVDLLTITSALETQHQLVEVGGTAYLVSLLETVPTSLHAEAYGRMVWREASARRATALATEIAKISYDQDEPPEMYNRIQSAVMRLGGQIAIGHDIEHISQIADSYYDTLRQLSANPTAFSGTPTGLADLDRLLGGWRAPDLCIVAGRPGMGKTSLMLTSGLHACLDQKKHVAIFSLEMSKY